LSWVSRHRRVKSSALLGPRPSTRPASWMPTSTSDSSRAARTLASWPPWSGRPRRQGADVAHSPGLRV